MCAIPLKIAVVDDDESVLDAVNIVLDDQQWDVYTYLSGEEFLEDLNHNLPDCVILDAHLSGMNGAEVTKSIVSSKKKIPIVVLTAYPESPLVSEMIKNGGEDILVKPITADILIEHIDRALSRLNIQRGNMTI